MKFEKKHYAMLAIGIIALLAVYYFFFYKKKGAESSFDPNLMIMGGPSFHAASDVVAPSRRSTVSIPGVTHGLGKVKFTAPITNTPQGCPQGSKQTTLPDGTYSCIPASTN